jgi:uncharacterized membrane protein YccC
MGLGPLFAGLCARGNHRSLDRHRISKHSRRVDFGHNLGADGADVRVTYSRVFGGMIGTVLAVGVVWLITSLGQSTVLFCATIFLAAFLLPSQITRFWIFSGMIAVIVLLAWDLASADPALEPALLWERLEDMLVGATLVLVLTALVFPDVTKSLLVAGLRRAE